MLDDDTFLKAVRWCLVGLMVGGIIVCVSLGACVILAAVNCR